MNRIWELLLGIERSPGTIAAEESRLEFAALPRGALVAVMILGAILLLAFLWWLYKWERRELSRRKRFVLVGLRAITLLAISAMLIEPVLVSIRRETLQSHLLLVLDDSESMRFSDPYTDESRAAATAAALKLESSAGRSPVDRLRETPRLDLVKSVLRPNLEALARGRQLFVYGLESASAQARVRRIVLALSTMSSRIARSRRWAMRFSGVLAAHRGQPVAGVILATDGRSNTGEDPLRAVEAAARQNIPIFSIAAGGEEGPRNIRLAEIEVSPVVFARDPMTLAVVVEARGLRDTEATIMLESRTNDGAWEPAGNQQVVLGEDGVLKRANFRITPRVVGQTEFRARVEDAGPELTKDDNIATVTTKVVRQQIRVLLIAGEASPEVQFLRNALLRDQHVEFAGWIQHADPGFRQPGDRPIQRLPANDSELRQYDALLLIDPDLRALAPPGPR